MQDPVELLRNASKSINKKSYVSFPGFYFCDATRKEKLDCYDMLEVFAAIEHGETVSNKKLAKMIYYLADMME